MVHPKMQRFVLNRIFPKALDAPTEMPVRHLGLRRASRGEDGIHVWKARLSLLV